MPTEREDDPRLSPLRRVGAHARRSERTSTGGLDTGIHYDPPVHRTPAMRDHLDEVPVLPATDRSVAASSRCRCTRASPTRRSTAWPSDRGVRLQENVVHADRTNAVTRFYRCVTGTASASISKVDTVALPNRSP